MLTNLVLNLTEARDVEIKHGIDVAANNIGLTMTQKQVAEVIIKREPRRRIEQVGVINVSPSFQPEIAEELMYDYDENQPIFCIAREHRIDLFQVA